MRYLDRGREESVVAGTVLYRAGDDAFPDGVYYVSSGRVRLTHGFPDGAKLEYEAQPGVLFGLVDSLLCNPRMFTAEVLEDSRLYVWQAEEFERAISVYIELADLTVQILSRHMRLMNEGSKQLG